MIGRESSVKECDAYIEKLELLLENVKINKKLNNERCPKIKTSGDIQPRHTHPNYLHWRKRDDELTKERRILKDNLERVRRRRAWIIKQGKNLKTELEKEEKLHHMIPQKRKTIGEKYAEKRRERAARRDAEIKKSAMWDAPAKPKTSKSTKSKGATMAKSTARKTASRKAKAKKTYTYAQVRALIKRALRGRKTVRKEGKGKDYNTRYEGRQGVGVYVYKLKGRGGF